MQRIAVINQKGGVGKTTTTVHVGAALALAGKRVLLVDLDPQGHLSLHFGVDIAEGQVTVYDVIVAGSGAAEGIVAARDNVHVLPADVDLAGAEAELISVPGRELVLREALASLEDRFDVLLVDCPPSLGVLTVNALVACDEVLIPLQAQFLALQGLGKLFETVALVRQRLNPRLTVHGVVLCMHDAGTRHAGEVVEDLSGFLEAARGTDQPWAGARLFEARIRRNIKLAESASFGQTVFDYAPKSNGATDYAALCEEMFGVEVQPALASLCEKPQPQSEGEAAPSQSSPRIPPSGAHRPSSSGQASDSDHVSAVAV
ncbi:MAG: ParA family protein [Phycisphaerae bacterium]|nr:ParA family protein [Phycisphaerae bacterium]